MLRRYSPFRHSGSQIIANKGALVRLACLIHAASVRSEPESNSHKEIKNGAGLGPGRLFRVRPGTSLNPSHPFRTGRSVSRNRSVRFQGTAPPEPAPWARSSEKRAKQSSTSPRKCQTVFFPAAPAPAAPPRRPRRPGPAPAKKVASILRPPGPFVNPPPKIFFPTRQARGRGGAGG